MSWLYSRALVEGYLGEAPRVADCLRSRMRRLLRRRIGRTAKRRDSPAFPDLG